MNDIYVAIAKVVESYLEGMELNSDDYEKNLVELGVDSVAFIHVIVEMEDKFDIEIPDEYLVPGVMDTISNMAKIIQHLIVQ